MGAGRVPDQVPRAAPAVRHVGLFLLAGLAMSGCPRPAKPRNEPPPARIAIAPGSSWTLVHGGASPVVRAKGHDVWIFAYAEAIEPDQHVLPGVAIGDGHGPSLGLLSGQFSPLVAFPDSRRPWPLTLTATATRLEIATGTIAVSIAAPTEDRVEMTLRGAPFVTAPADRTTVRGP